MGVRLVLAADTVWLHSERCWQLGMIVYELVTNVTRHAFFEAADGEVRVELSRSGAFARCVVSDNGSVTGSVRPGRGLKIVGDLAESLGCEVGRSFGVNGSLFTLAVPFVGREQPANEAPHGAFARDWAHGSPASCTAMIQELSGWRPTSSTRSSLQYPSATERRR